MWRKRPFLIVLSRTFFVYLNPAPTITIKMKKTSFLNVFAFALAGFMLMGCQFSVGTKKDLNTGLSVSYNGFKVDDVFLTNKAGERLSSNKIPISSTIFMVANNVSNYTLRDGKAYPGCEITVKDKSGKILGHIDDAMAAYSKNGVEPASATALSANMTLRPPFLVGETYHVSVRFFDKENAKSKITGDVHIVLQ